ncbi:MAG: CAP domain-containing protein [Pseudomonadota bacterium]
MMRFAILIVASVCVAACATDTPTKPSFYNNISVGEPFDAVAAASMINSYRQNEGLPPLALDAGLSSIAAEESRAVAFRQRRTGRVTPSGDLDKRVSDGGYTTSGMKRNVSAGYYTIAEAFSGWRESRQHRATLLSDSGSRMGIAAVNVPNAKYKVYWTMIVANPAQSAALFSSERRIN